ncbi:hypothetical protein DAKH74_035280 [Maudiozyma humilis]|uniref:Vacuolar membrane protein n=1 Tax=Maudiozyma humilis TaxID=51915 RepID=A0AAV5RZY5_MAUHU|nr:hypothetical protein DAKH74_035280 [Kazachstania humilis]
MPQRMPKTGTCQLLGPVSLVIQFLMGILVVIVLLIKREYEHPRRRLIVWSYDTGKQIGGSLSIHFINLALSVVKRKRGAIVALLVAVVQGHYGGGSPADSGDDEQCDWYFLNLLLDTTIGIPILWVILKGLNAVLQHFKVKNVESGNYFADDDKNTHQKPMFTAFLKQLLVFVVGLVLMKACIFLILNYFEDAAYWFANLILGWADKWPNFQVFLVMFVSPVLLNCFQYCCIDNIIKLHAINYNNLDSFERDTFSSDEEDEAGEEARLTPSHKDSFLTKLRRYRRRSNNSSLYGSTDD